MREVALRGDKHHLRERYCRSKEQRDQRKTAVRHHCRENWRWFVHFDLAKKCNLTYWRRVLRFSITKSFAPQFLTFWNAWGTFGERERERYRERERERDRRRQWRHHCRAKIGDEFCTSPCQKCAPQYWRRVLRFSLPKFCTSVSHLLKCAEFTLSIAKNVALFETVRILRTVKWRDWQGIEAAKHTIEFPAAPFFFLVEKIEKMNQINTKNYWK